MLDALFWEVHSGLKRDGPGDDASFQRALALMVDLPAHPRILDVGCGPGAQTLALLQATDGTVFSVDTHQEFLDTLKTEAAARGFANRVHTLNASMTDMPFGEGSFDVIWSEGALYMMGFREGLSAWKRLLRPGGYVAATEPCWLKPESDIPEEVRKAWCEYGDITTVDRTVAKVSDAGYREVGHFVLPETAWWEYYRPQESRIAQLRCKYVGDARALQRLDELQSEIELYRRLGDCYGYLFVIMRLL